MTDTEAIQALIDLRERSTDAEGAHTEADRILIEFLRTNGHANVARAWMLANETVGFWYA